jgi:inosose dehydratase
VTVTITTAPCCWGVDDVANPNLPPWERVFEEASSAGYGGLELGPYGYVPLQPGVVTRALKQNNLFIVAGTIFDDLVATSNRENLLRQTAEICELVTALPHPDPFPKQRFPVPYLTVMDWGHDERDFAAGHSDRAPRLNNSQWHGMIDNIKAIADLARTRFGVRTVIHPHAGGYIEFSDEVARAANDVRSETAGSASISAIRIMPVWTRSKRSETTATGSNTFTSRTSIKPYSPV